MAMEMEREEPLARRAAPAPAVEGLTRYGGFVTFMALAGWTLVSLDGSFFTFAMPLIMGELKIDFIQVGYLYTISFGLAWVACLLAGPLLDYWGRKNVFQLTLIGTVVGSVLSAVSWGFGSLVAFRSITQAGNSAEWSAGQQILAEEAPSRMRGMLTGLAQLGWPLGWFIAVLVAMAVVPTLGWRWLFAIGVVPGILVVFARRWLREPPRAVDVEHLRAVAHDEAEAKRVQTEFAVAKEKAVHFTYGQLFEPDLLRATITISLFILLYNIGMAVTQYFIPIIVMSMGYSLVDTYIVAAFSFGAAVVGYIIHGWLGDRIGRREAILAFILPSIAGYWFLANYATTLTLVILFYTILYFFGASLYSSMVGFALESFPTRARGTGGSLAMGMTWLGIMIMGLIGPRFAEAYGIPGALLIHSIGFMGAAWIVLWFAKRVRPGQALEAVAT